MSKSDMEIWKTFGLLLVVQLITGHPISDSRDDVVELTSENFNQIIGADNKFVWIVLFYSSLDKTSNSLVTGYLKAASELKGRVKFGFIDANNDKETETMSEQTTTSSVPEIKIFTGKSSAIYKGEPDAEAIVEAALEAHKETFGSYPEPPSSTDKVGVFAETESVSEYSEALLKGGSSSRDRIFPLLLCCFIATLLFAL